MKHQKSGFADQKTSSWKQQKIASHCLLLVFLQLTFPSVGTCRSVPLVNRDEESDRGLDGFLALSVRRPEDQACGLNPIDIFLTRLYEEVEGRIGLLSSSTVPTKATASTSSNTNTGTNDDDEDVSVFRTRPSYDRQADLISLMKGSYERLLYTFTLLYKNNPGSYYGVLRSVRMWNRCQENQQKTKVDVRRHLLIKTSETGFF